jgi:hypothetical protein
MAPPIALTHGLKLRSQFLVVVYLTVVCDRRSTIAKRHGLRARVGQLQDAQSSMAKADTVLDQ